MVFSVAEKREIICLFAENNYNASATRRAYAARHPDGPIPTRCTIKTIFTKFRITSSLQRKKRELNENTENHDLNILLHYVENPSQSIRTTSKEMRARYGPRRSSREYIRKILKKYGFRPYKYHRVQKLTHMHKIQRLNFCNLMLNRLNNERDFFEKILWTDESSFSTSGLPNRQNYRHWAQQNPQFDREVRFQGRRTINVWCGLLKNRIIGPYFLEGTLTGPLYHQFLETRLQNMLENLPLRQYMNMIFQHDGAPPHVIREVNNFLNNNHNEWIGRNGTIAWPSNSPDLTPMDNFFWGYIKNKVYERNFDNVEDMKHCITQEIRYLNERNSNFIENAIEHLQTVYQECIDNEGGNIHSD